MGIVNEGPSGDGKQLIFDVIARNWSLEEWKERSDTVKINPENNILLKTHDMINYINVCHLHTVSTKFFIFNTTTGISLLCFGNLVGNMVVFFVFELQLIRSAETQKDKGEAVSVPWL